jgi:AcrR family transcriptional regulator
VARRDALLAGNSAGQTTRRRIIAGARRHFLAHGFRGVTMDDLAAELGMSKKTLYSHFASKPAIVEAAILAKFAELDGELGRITKDHAADFAAALRLMLACVLRHAEEVSPAFLRDVRRDKPELFQLIESRRGAMIQRHFGKLFAAGRKAGRIRADVPTALLIEILLAAVQGVMTPRKLTDLAVTPKAGFAAIISILLDGVLTTTGRARR